MMLNIKVPKSERGQELLNFYRIRAENADELSRINLAKELCSEWIRNKIVFPIPAVKERSDYWYLIQLFFLKRHVNLDKSEYFFNLAQEEEIIIDDFPELDFSNLTKMQKSSDILSEVFSCCGDPPFSRKALEDFISKKGQAMLDSFKLDSQKFKLVPIPFDVYIRLGKIMDFGKHDLNTFFDGYRLRPNGELRALFGGNKLFGGVNFIDSIWLEYNSMFIVPRLVIIRKNYGEKPQ